MDEPIKLDYSSDKMMFFMTIYYDNLLIPSFLDGFRKHFPTERLVIISDGVDTDLSRYDSYNFTFINGKERLKIVPNGGRFLQRSFETALDGGSEPFLCKIDPDSRIYRKFNYLLDWPFYGSVLEDKHVQGGCQVFQRSKVQEIVDSKFLLDPKVGETTYWATSKNLQEWAKTTNITSIDFLTRRVFLDFGVIPQNWSEVSCRWKYPPINPIGQDGHPVFAVTHPHKLGLFANKKLAIVFK